MANTDKFIQAARRFSTTIGSGGVADAVVTTVPITTIPAVFSNGDTIEFVVNRVSTTGTLTPDNEETIVGTVSGSNVITCDRGVEGTAQAHSAGDVVEIKLTADMWNRLIEGILNDHSQLGKHTQVSLVPSSAPAPTTQGLTKYDSDDDKIKYGDGSNTRTVVTEDQSATMTNKRVTPRVSTETSSATPTINTDNVDMHTITALAAAITSMTTNLSGTPTNGQKLIIRFKDDGTARAITWGASFASRGATLPTTTVISKTMYVGLIWNSTASTWDCVAVSTEA